MNIYEVLETLEGYLTLLSGIGILSDEELIELEEVKESINYFVKGCTWNVNQFYLLV